MLNFNLKNQNDRFVARKNNLAIFLSCFFYQCSTVYQDNNYLYTELFTFLSQNLLHYGNILIVRKGNNKITEL